MQELVCDYDEAICGMTGIFYNPRVLLHEDGDEESVERPARARLIYSAIKRHGLLGLCRRVRARPAKRREVTSVHSAPYYRMIMHTKQRAIQQLRETRNTTPSMQQKNRYLDDAQDTYINAYSSEAASIATGGLLEMATKVVEGTLKNGFAIIRPPGHHAKKNKAMGFCLFNHVAVTAKLLRKRFPERVKRVLIVDWDVHHGNGTQSLFEYDPNVLYFSVHRYDSGSFFPGTGSVNSVGRGAGVGKTINVPLPTHGYGDMEYLRIFQQILLPAAKEYEPDLILVSAGFDSAYGDIGGMNVTSKGFAQMLSLLVNTDIVPNSKCVVALEGGYNLPSLVPSALEVVKVLLGFPPSPIPESGHESEDCAWSEKKQRERNAQLFDDLLARVLTVQRRYWDCFERLLRFKQKTRKRGRIATNAGGLPQVGPGPRMAATSSMDGGHQLYLSLVKETKSEEYSKFLGQQVRRVNSTGEQSGFVTARVLVDGVRRWQLRFSDGSSAICANSTLQKLLGGGKMSANGKKERGVEGNGGDSGAGSVNGEDAKEASGEPGERDITSQSSKSGDSFLSPWGPPMPSVIIMENQKMVSAKPVVKRESGTTKLWVDVVATGTGTCDRGYGPFPFLNLQHDEMIHSDGSETADEDDEGGRFLAREFKSPYWSAAALQGYVQRSLVF